MSDLEDAVEAAVAAATSAAASNVGAAAAAELADEYRDQAAAIALGDQDAALAGLLSDDQTQTYAAAEAIVGPKVAASVTAAVDAEDIPGQITSIVNSAATVAVAVQLATEDAQEAQAAAEVAQGLAEDAQAAAEAAQVAAEAVGDSNDTIIASRLNDNTSASYTALDGAASALIEEPTSAVASSLSASFEPKTNGIVTATLLAANSATANTTILTDALTAAAAFGAAVRLPAGTFSTNDITATASIIGAGRQRTIINGGRFTYGAHNVTFADLRLNTSDAYAFVASQKNDCILANVEVTHTGTVQLAGQFDRVNRLRVTGCKFAVGGLELITTVDYVIDANYFDCNYQNTNEPIHCTQQSSGVIYGNTIKNTLTDAIDHYSSGEYCVIANNRLYGLRGAAGIELKITMSDSAGNTSGPGNVIDGVIVTGNILRDFQPPSAGTHAGIFAEYVDSRGVPAFTVTETARALVITNNVLEDFNVSDPGFVANYIAIAVTAHNSIVSGNVIRNMKAWGSVLMTGIGVNWTSSADGRKSVGLQVKNNTIVGVENGYGIQTGDMERCHVSGNVIRGDEVNGTTVKYGLNFIAGADIADCQIVGNTFECNNASGVGLRATSNACTLTRTVVANNSIKDCGVTLLCPVNMCTFSGNVTDNALNSLLWSVGLTGGTNRGNVFTGNTWTMSSDYALALYDCNGFSIIGNTFKDTARGLLFNGATKNGTVTGNVSFSQVSGVEFPHYSGVTAADQATIFVAGNVVNDALPFNQPGRLITVTGIDAKTTGTTTLYTVPTGKTAIITGAVVRCTAASAITVAPTLGIGVAAGEDDIFPSTTLTGLTTTGKGWAFDPGGLAVTAAAAAVIKLGIDTAATGTSQTLAIDLLGYLV